MKSSALYRYLSQTAPASSFPGERYLLLTESLLLRRQFSTSPQGSAARRELSLLLLLQLLLNCACRSIHAGKKLQEACAPGQALPGEKTYRILPKKSSLDTLFLHRGTVHATCGAGEWVEVSENPSSPRFLPGLLFAQRSFGCDASATHNHARHS